MASKLLNIIFSAGEIVLLGFLLKPELTFSISVISLFGFMVAAILATLIYYLVSCCARFVAFWMPENTWGLAFLVLIFMEILAGGIFPLNILPSWIYTFLQFTPFPYLVYFPIAIFSGKIIGWEMLRILGQSALLLLAMFWLTKFIWKKGMMVYHATGR